jgi:endonuclease YncB( thermonuclease family)
VWLDARVARGVSPGWYPDYESPSGHERYWDGERWSERRVTAPQAPRTSRTVWVWATAAALVVLGAAGVAAAALAMGDGDGASAPPGSSPPPATTPGPSASERSTTSPGAAPTSAERSWQVGSVVDGITMSLSNGADVRLAGLAEGCSVNELSRLVVGRTVTLLRSGPDKDSDGRLVRYVDRDGIDIGKRLIQRGLATASADTNPRGAIYRRIDERSPSHC